ncbi:unnamed protein product [Ilex paraguariensis]|uniref:RNase H type-1 domain-containing protein n=1 Tax=Ilex paraguariensis TaxID=185542 RepID=A0ABC8T1D0_9AQUA
MAITELHPLRVAGTDTLYKQVVSAPWSAPPPVWVKVNCDGAFSATRKRGAYATVARDHTCQVIAASSGKMCVASALASEAWVIWKACYLALTEGWRFVIFESDSKALIDSLLTAVNFLFVNRSANQLAHMIAHLTNCGSLPVDWFLNPPFHVLQQIQQDVRVGIG